MKFEETLNDFIKDFAREYGEKKVRDVIAKVEKAKTVEKALKQLKQLRTYPRAGDAIATVMNMPYFMFAKKLTVALGAVLFLELWNNYDNHNNKYLDDSGLYMIFRKILYECGQMV